MTYIYILICTTFPLMFLESDKIQISHKKRYINLTYILSCLTLIFFAVFRSIKTGVDVEMYKLLYYFNQWHKEFGYGYLIRFFRFFGIDFRMFVVFCAFVSLSSIFFGIYKISKKKGLSLFLFQTLYLYAASYSLLRQYISMCFMIFSILLLREYIKQKDLKKYILAILLILISVSFHQSSILLLIIPVLAVIKLDLKKIIAFSLLGLVLLLFRNQIITAVFTALHKESYVKAPIEFGIVPFSQFLLTTGLIYFYRRKHQSELSEVDQKLIQFDLNISVFWLIMLTFFTWIPLLARFTLYFLLYMVFVIPQYIQIKKWQFLVVITILIGFYWGTLHYRDYQRVNPYRFDGTFPTRFQMWL